ncbi:hypothetical protein SDC9_122263 [bioreactor metagenome]|uniref:Uncharacterized protein n=1 Tax=bioreactor metagenome TaxID=1076179 RepID=A0A645CE96_9ZZZZ
MCVLALQVGALAVFFYPGGRRKTGVAQPRQQHPLALADFFYMLHGGVHLAVHIGGFKRNIRFVVDRPCVVQRQCGLAHLDKTAPHKALVAKAPKNDRGVVSQQRHHVLHAVNAVGRPVRVVAGQLFGEAVGL